MNEEKINVANAVVTLGFEATSGIKPGYKTTEFWLTSLTVLVNLGLSSGLFTDAEAGELTTALPYVVNAALIIGYAVSRAYAKRGTI
jgi:hypothetical protein